MNATTTTTTTTTTTRGGLLFRHQRRRGRKSVVSCESSSSNEENSLLTQTAEEAIRNAPPAPERGEGAKRRVSGYMNKKTTKDWQIDFCSRPLKDDRGKKVWELLITDEDRSFEHAEFFPNNRINSVELSKA